MRLGYNVLSIDGDFWRHLDTITPGSMVFFQNQIDAAKEAKKRYPNAHIMVRFWPDAETFRRYPDPVAWVASHADLIGTGLIVQTINEGGFSNENILWHERLLTYLLNNGIDLRVGILGLNVGTPKPEEWPQALNLLRLLARLRDRAFLVLHEYFGSVITSGIIGGDPNNAGVAHGQPGGTNLIPFAAWPTTPAAMTLWHVGRYWFLKRYLATVGVNMPQIIIGEFGADYLGDIDAWLRSLQSSQGQYDTVDGWRDLLKMWSQWYPNVAPGDVYMRMAAYADQKIYGADIVGINFFAYGNDGNWKQYQTNPDLTPWLEAYKPGAPVIVPPPIVVTPPPPPPTTQPPVVIDRSAELKARVQKTLDEWK